MAPTTINVKEGQGSAGKVRGSVSSPVKVLDTGTPRRTYWIASFDYGFDLCLAFYWFYNRSDSQARWRLDTCIADGTPTIQTLADAATLIDKTWNGTAQGLWFVFIGSILLKELLGFWVMFRVLRKRYRSNLSIQEATSIFGCLGATFLVPLRQSSPAVGNPSEDDPDNPTILEDINVTVGCCIGQKNSLRSWWMTLCILENTISLVFAMHSIGGCLMKDLTGLFLILASLLTTVVALVTRAMRITAKKAPIMLPGVRKQSSFYGATEHGDLEVFENCAVLTSDLSGFTKTTKNYGIVFMAAVIQRMRQISLPIAYAEKPHSVGFEADDLIIVFRDVDTAFRAAAIINYLIIKLREEAPKDEVHFWPKLGGLGLHCGPKILKHRNGHQLYGATASEAYHVGEEMAEKEFCISEAVYKQLGKNVQALFKEKVYMKDDLGDDGKPVDGAEKIEDSEEHEGSKPGGPVYARDFTLPASEILQALDPSWSVGKEDFKGSSYGVKVADTKDMSCLPDQMDLLMQIQWPKNRAKEKWDAISVQIRKKYEVEKVALLCDIQFSNDSSPTEQVTLEGERESIVNAAIIPNKGVSQDDKLTMFDSVKDATLAVIALRRGLAEWNLKQTEDKFKMECNGFGIHKSDCLVIPGTDVHWGYAVNAASKIGEDCGEDGEILLMDSCYKIIKDMPEFKDVFWIQKDLEASGNKFCAYQLNERDGPFANTEPENGEVAPDTEPVAL